VSWLVFGNGACVLVVFFFGVLFVFSRNLLSRAVCAELEGGCRG